MRDLTPSPGRPSSGWRQEARPDPKRWAVEVSVYVVRAFVKLRELVGSHLELARRLDDLEQKTEALAMNHDTFSRNTRNQLKQVFDALRELMTPPDPPKRPIGFINPEDTGSKKSGGRARLKT